MRCLSLMVFLAFAAAPAHAEPDVAHKGLDVKKSGLIPRYPPGLQCPVVTSFYASWDDVDGTRRDEPHSGIDAGALGDTILAPAPGVVVAAWRANWGWGHEGAILLQHSRKDLGLNDGPPFYYSEFDHLDYDEVRRLEKGDRVARGEALATVFRPGGKSRYLPEVHWEVWQLDDDDETRWSTNEFGGRFWLNPTARLIDPLYMLSRAAPPAPDGSVDLPIFRRGADDAGFRGFTYIFACRPADAE